MKFLKNIFLNKKNSIEYIIVGLGNPGAKYENTRHNAGFIAIDYIAKELEEDFIHSKFQALYTICKFCDKKIILLKPQTFMNLSGESVRDIMAFYKVPSEKVIILFDDISLPIGKIRIRRDGSHGGQNGMKNIIELCGTNKFPRVKIGIGQKPNPEWDLADWVLSKFTCEELKNINSAVKNVMRAVTLIIQGDIEKAMNNYN